MKPKTRDLRVHLLVAVFLVWSTISSQAQTFVFDEKDSEIGFRIGSLAGAAEGQFRKFSGTLQFNSERVSESKVKVKIAVDSVDTNSRRRDAHLLEEDFFHSERYPFITFESRGFRKAGSHYLITGPLSIRGVTKNISLRVKLKRAGELWTREGKVMDFQSQTQLNRMDFGVSGGRPAVAKDLDVTLRIKALETRD